MDVHGVDWVAVLAGERLMGWRWGSELPPAGPMGSEALHPFRVTIPATASLREALDAIVNTRNNVAVVCDGERYLGMLTLDRLSRELTR
jgi:hypothetical protein